ncbi:N-glycosylase/DNA lyase [Candidatus Pacearchaeota archaeon]|nr:N-glycosylase/DNA lyase [Candidatus Pacearchaeota archaeon]
MQALISQVNEVKNQNVNNIKEIIINRIKEFESISKGSAEDIFKELCFCLLTANYSSAGGIKIQKTVGNGFMALSEAELAEMLHGLGHRFPNARAKFIIEARRHLKNIPVVLKNLEGEELRGWFVDNIKGFGHKEASHFLRNIGFKDYAVVDFHIVDILNRHNLLEGIERKKALNKKKYHYVEGVLRRLSESLNMSLAELDLYLWYLETGKVLK